MQVLLQPCGNKDAQQHLAATILKSVPLQRIQEVHPAAAKALAPDSQNGELRLWALKPELKKKLGEISNDPPSEWKQLGQGPTLVAFIGPNGKIEAIADVGAQIDSLPTSRIWWKDAVLMDDNKQQHSVPFRYIYGATNVRPSPVDYPTLVAKINETLGTQRGTRTPPGALILKADEAAVATAILLGQAPSKPQRAPLSIPFVKGQAYSRLAIANQYGGSPQAGISPSAKTPFIFLFPSEKGKSIYPDRIEPDGTIHYLGQGKTGDQKFEGPNQILGKHRELGRPLLYFQVWPSHTYSPR